MRWHLPVTSKIMGAYRKLQNFYCPGRLRVRELYGSIGSIDDFATLGTAATSQTLFYLNV